MNWIDVVIIIALVLFAVHGWRRGLVLTSLDLVGLLLALVAALLAYGFIGSLIARLGLPGGIANALAFVGVFIIVDAVFWALVRGLYRRVPRAEEASPMNRALGVLPGLAKGFIFAGLLVLLFAYVPLGVSRETISESLIGGFFLEAGSAVRRSASAIIPDDIAEDFGFITIRPDSGESVDIPVVENARVDAEAEAAMLEVLNRDRISRGLKPLEMDPELRRVARSHSKDMFERGYFSHVSPEGTDPFERMRNAGVRFARAGENLAYAPTVRIAHRGLMNSPGHRRNILDPNFERIGIGVYEGPMGTKVFTQQFAS